MDISTSSGMSDKREENIGKWFDPLQNEKERRRLEGEISGDEINDLEKIWKRSADFKPPTGAGRAERWSRLEEAIDHESKVIPLYQSKAFRTAIGFFVAASVMFFTLFLLKPNDDIFDQEIVSKRGEFIEWELPDGSSVHLNAESSIKYSSEGFLDNRSVILSGEGFFKVVESAVPFSVKNDQTIISVLGTSFNIRSRSDGLNVACLTGKVSVKLENEEVILTKGFATDVKSEKIKSRYEIKEAEIGSWRRKEFYFNEAPLSEVFAEIERQFSVTVRSELDFNNSKFTGYFSGEDLQKSVSIVCLTAGLDYSIQGKTVTLQ